jgi:hypothetical protein
MRQYETRLASGVRRGSRQAFLLHNKVPRRLLHNVLDARLSMIEGHDEPVGMAPDTRVVVHADLNLLGAVDACAFADNRQSLVVTREAFFEPRDVLVDLAEQRFVSPGAFFPKAHYG